MPRAWFRQKVSNWLSLSEQSRKNRYRQPAKTRLCLEQLEDRLTPALTTVSNVTTYPIRAVVEVQTFWQDGATSIGSGVMIDSFHVLTAGHMIYDARHDGLAAQILVTPALNGHAAPFGQAKMVWERVPPNFEQIDNEYPNTFFNDSSDTDIGLITLNNAIGNNTGNIPLFNFSGQQQTFFNGLPVATAGYPAPKDDNGNSIVLTNGTNPPGNIMYGEAGTTSGVTNDGFEIESTQSGLETHPGQSGSPIWINTFGNNVAIVGIVVSGNNSTGQATVITSDCYNWITSCVQYDVANFPPQPAPGPATVAWPAGATTTNDQANSALSSFRTTPSNAYSASGTQPSPGATTTTLSATASSVQTGQPVQFTAVVTSAVSYTPTGTVTFLDGTTLLGTANLVTTAGVTSATFSTALAAGTRTITAVYYGDTNDLSSRSAPVTEQVVQHGLGSLSNREWPVNQSGYSGTIPVNFGSGVYSNLQVTGLPTGVAAALSGNTIVLSGTPTQTGTFSNIAVSLEDSTGAGATATYTLVIDPPLTPTMLVTTTSDATGHTGESLRDAVTQADSDAAQGHADTIGFAPALAGQTITLVQGKLVLSGTGTITINGGGQITVSGNNAGLVFQVNSGIQVVLSGLNVTAGGISNGSQINEAAGGGNLSLQNCTVNGNSGIYSNGTLLMNNCVLSGNSSSNGGAMWNDGTATLVHSTISGNAASYLGGGIANVGYLSTAHLTLSDCTITGNSAGEYGGGLENYGVVTLTNCTISNNATGSGGGGGGINENGGILTLLDSTMSGNTALAPNKGGGGLSISASNSTVTVTNSTIAGNSTPGKGGGIYNGYPGESTGTVLTLQNSIVASNVATTAAPDVDTNSANGATVSANYSLIGNTTGSGIAGGTGNILNPTATGLSTLGNFDGPTQTIALLAGSPAIDAGSNSLARDGQGHPLATDQRGLPRIANGTVDMGAFEVQPVISLSATSVAEFQPVGTVVGTFTSAELTPGHTFTYSLVSGAGATDNADFRIQGAQLQTAAILAYDLQSSYNIRVRTTDETGQSFEQVFTITVLSNPALSLQGNTLTVQGTPGSDTFTFVAGSPEQITLNSATYSIAPTVVSAIHFIGNGGSDSATLTGSGGDYAALNPTYASLNGANYTVVVVNCSNVTMHSSGNATADFGLSASGFDTYKGTPTFSAAIGANYSNTVIGFAHAHGFASGNRNALAYLATSGAADIFGGVPAYSFVQGPNDNYDSYAIGFALVDGFAESTSAIAYLGTSATGQDVFGSVPAFSFVSGANYAVYVIGFYQTQADAGSANAIAYMGTAAGDTFVGTYSYSVIFGTTYTNYAIGFARVQAYGNTNTVAYLQQFSGSDPYTNWGGAFESKGNHYDNFAINFTSVIASQLHP